MAQGQIEDGGASETIARLLRGYRTNRPLPGKFYTRRDVFDLDLARVYGRRWLYVCHACQIPGAGDWLTYRVGSDSIVVVRGEDGAVRAFFNTCRHRGSIVCTGDAGRSKHLVCPYHNWTYGLDGKLATPIEREFGVDRRDYGLRPVALREVEGLVFFNLSDAPEDFAPVAADIGRRLKPHGLDRSKLAHAIDYTVEANWKLVFENNRECYHCIPNHPEYNAATYDVARDMARLNPDRQVELDAIVAKANARFRALGLDEGDAQSIMTGAYWRAHRTPLMAGFVTQSLDGKPVAPLMGDFKERDAGTLRITIFPNFWQHASDDHAVATRITPVGPAECHVRVMWFVDKDAIEGKDYALDRLLPVWQRTSEQDWVICENQQRGVASRAYAPGPYSREREYNVDHFVRWYLGEIGAPVPEGADRGAA